MKLAGIICEYNPFHLGHMTHIEHTRALAGGDVGIVCAMSGNFVQRGEPAILPKHARAEAAVLCGADLVIEIPTVWAAASAERFAMGGVAVLAALGLPMALSFGSECGDLDALTRAAVAVDADEVQAAAKVLMREGISYAAARERAVGSILGKEAALLREPNNILGIEYIKAINRLGASHLTPMTFRRTLTAHDGEENGGLAPASLLRERLRAHEDVTACLPAASADILKRELEAGRAPADIRLIEPAILCRLRTMTAEDYARLPDASEGLDTRLMNAGRAARSYAEVLEKAKTKRYAMSRLRRMVLAAALGITADRQKAAPSYIRVLAMNARGREILRDAAEAASLPILTKPAAARLLGADVRRDFEREAMFTDIYSLCFPSASAREGGLEWKISPIIR